MYDTHLQRRCVVALGHASSAPAQRLSSGTARAAPYGFMEAKAGSGIDVAKRSYFTVKPRYSLPGASTAGWIGNQVKRLSVGCDPGSCTERCSQNKALQKSLLFEGCIGLSRVVARCFSALFNANFLVCVYVAVACVRAYINIYQHKYSLHIWWLINILSSWNGHSSRKKRYLSRPHREAWSYNHV